MTADRDRTSTKYFTNWAFTANTKPEFAKENNSLSRVVI